MKNILNFVQNDIPNQDRIKNALKGCLLLCILTIISSITLYSFDVIKLKWIFIMGFSPFILYISLYLAILMQFLIVGLLQIFYSKVYGWHKKIWNKKS